MKIKDFILHNKSFLCIAFVYAVLQISVLSWGIPNNNHPFTYHMDEWHQLQSVRNVFIYGSPNVEGSAHGTIFQFFLSGIYLIPFYILQIIDPFAITSSIAQLDLQTRLFEVLRINTLLFGILSLWMVQLIAKQFFKIPPFLPLSLFTFTPLFLSLSNYFKYDVALLFWILASLFFLLRFGALPSLRNYLLAGVVCSIALSTKFSALPIIPIYIFSFFYFNQNSRKQYRYVYIGMLVFIATFLLCGIPDVMLGKADYGNFFSSNLANNSAITNNYILEYRPWWVYLLLIIMPIDFGYVFFPIFLIVFFYWVIRITKNIIAHKINKTKNEFFILWTFIFFILSIMPLELGANGNRLLVFLPFFVILTSCFLLQIYKHISVFQKKIAVGVFFIFVILQCLESLILISVKWQPDPRQTASVWLRENIKKGNTIGIENIPIYQMLPDVVVKEFYTTQEHPTVKTTFYYKVIDVSTDVLPNNIIITNKELESNYFKKSAKKDLLKRIIKEGYVIKKEFKPSVHLYKTMKNEFYMFISGLVPIPTITVYSKPT